ncbi:glycosyltransferase [Vibrio cholerae]|nr:glycosyltransferase [Vibrio cholerae]
MIDISFIIPCYNSRNVINGAINSIICQHFNVEYEIIIVDDGSTDDLLSVLPENDNIRYIRKENGGVASARNVGIDNALGEYLIFLDSDDRFNDGLIKRLESLLNRNIDLISWDFDIHLENGKVISKGAGVINGYINSECLLDEFFKKNIYQHICSICIRSSIINKQGIRFNENLKYAEDILFQIQVMLHSKECYHINEKYFSYIRNSDSAMAKALSIDRFLYIDEIKYGYFNDSLKDNAFFVNYIATIFSLDIINAIKTGFTDPVIIDFILDNRSVISSSRCYLINWPQRKLFLFKFFSPLIFSYIKALRYIKKFTVDYRI